MTGKSEEMGVRAVGRHSADARPPVNQSAAKPRSRSRLAAVMTVGAALTLVGATVLGVSAAGVPLLGRGPTEVAPSAPTPTPRPAVAITQTPAHQSFASLLNQAPNSAWQPVGQISWIGGTPYDQTCGRPPQLGPSISGSRVYQAAGGQVMVSVMAYSAGLGAGAFQDWQHQLSTCTGVSTYSVPGPTSASSSTTSPTDALVAWGANVKGSATASLMWRRGDILTWISAPEPMQNSLGTKSLQFDQLLLSVISGSCASVDSVLADAARNPWLAPKDFTGLIQQVPVAVSHAPWPTLPPGSTPVPHTYVPSPAPSISYPSRPADPVWPLDLPTPVATPELPITPTLPPSATSVPSRAPDPIGPGCGWAFTGQVPPRYDEVQQVALAQGLADQARAALLQAQAQWQSNTLAYWQQVPTYAAQLQDFLAYAAAVRDVALSWDSISAQRDAYDKAVAAYNDALAAQQQFITQQQQAQAAYDAALTACANAPVYTPLPLPTSSPSDTASPTSSTGPIPTDTASPTGIPTGPTSTPTPSPPGPVGCPPKRPAILDQQVPTLPPVPTPPPDPRPSVSASPTG
jgi:hypothetical protein